MSITSALATAVTGLTAASRSAELVSNNVSNAMTEGYGRREIQLSGARARRQRRGRRGRERAPRRRRHRDPRPADRRRGRGGRVGALLLPRPDRPGSSARPTIRPPSPAGPPPSNRPCVAAASRPDSTVRLQNVLDAATALTGDPSTRSPSAYRPNAPRPTPTSRGRWTISTAASGKSQNLNAQILRLDPGAGGHGPARSAPERHRPDRDIVPLREYPRDNGTIALYTTTGAGLLEGSAQPRCPSRGRP
jgi:flagellar hook-associated protein 1